MKNNGKITIFLAGDSTVQSYSEEVKPMTGWGEMLHKYFKEESISRSFHSQSEFEQAVCYETDGMFIDNRAMAGRSSRSFYNEGRLDDIERSLGYGDYLFAQFAHNDANKGKEERYVTLDQYEEYLLKYLNVCRAKKAQLVLVTAIAMRNCDDNPQKSYTMSFPGYRERMLEMGRKYDIPVLDLGKATLEYCQKKTPEESKELYMWLKPGEYQYYPEGKQDNAHLKTKGAFAYAGLLCGLIKAYSADTRLDNIKRWLKEENYD